MSALPRTALVMAGGTGGHVMPALAVAEALRGEGWRVVWLGTREGMEARLVGERGFEMAWVDFAGVRGKGLVSLAFLPLRILRAFWQALQAIRRIRPNVVAGLGGYVAFPGGMMASLLNKPLVIHEQNAVAGMTNRVLACLADRVLLGLPGAFEHRVDKPIPCRKVEAEWVGNPVRAAIAGLAAPAERYAGREGPLRLLVIGGSLGAKALNEIVPGALALMPPEARPQVRHQAGARNIDELTANYAAAGVEAECLAFIDDMAAAYAWADAVICRAGASTVAELAAAGVPAALVPFPYAVDDHQTLNARFLADAGAAWLMPQSELTAEKLAAWLVGLNRADLLDRAEKARALARVDATARMVAVVKEIAK
ncbi:MAG: undecaprenyldiphospho-muramoylpentapeptide beta-N-acetylglucosaminyltransferase [Gallionellaceae bacterium]|nr:undecaprenyldiphospho-muramoylpentapeptide beta-N-acetylglucosaminyltransferase [Gallionellaceae bacterium]